VIIAAPAIARGARVPDSLTRMRELETGPHDDLHPLTWPSKIRSTAR
jgi:hypothetical protein